MIIEKAGIYAIPLLKNLGFLYVRLLTYIYTEPGSLSGNVIKVYNFNSDKVDKSVIDLDLMSKGEIIQPLLLLGKPRIQRVKERWHYIRDSFCYDSDFQPLVFKLYFDSWYSKENAEDYDWYEVHNFRPQGIHKVKYDDIKHLGLFRYYVQDVINTRLTLEWIRYNGWKFEDFFSNEELADNNLRLDIIDTLNDIPLIPPRIPSMNRVD